MADEHFGVDGTLIGAAASIRSFRRRDDDDGSKGDGEGPNRGRCIKYSRPAPRASGNWPLVIVPLGGSIVTLNRGGTMMSTKKYRIRLTPQTAPPESSAGAPSPSSLSRKRRHCPARLTMASGACQLDPLGPVGLRGSTTVRQALKKNELKPWLKQTSRPAPRSLCARWKTYWRSTNGRTRCCASRPGRYDVLPRPEW